jgi:hypothetical protein
VGAVKPSTVVDETARNTAAAENFMVYFVVLSMVLDDDIYS